MHVVVMQAGQHGSAAGVEHALPGFGDKVVAHFVDPRADPDVGVVPSSNVAR